MLRGRTARSERFPWSAADMDGASAIQAAETFGD